MTTIFLCSGFSAWGINSFLLMLIGFMIENARVSVVKMATIYISIGILTSFFTVVCERALSCGNIGILAGLPFALIAEVILNWKPMAKIANGMLRIIMIFLAVILFLFVLMTSFAEDIGQAFR